MPRKKSENLTVDQERFVRMEANGYSRAEIIQELFGVSREDERFHAEECRLSRWSDHPKYAETWLDEVGKADFKDYSKSRRTLRRSMDSPDQWLAMQAAVNVMNNSGKRIFGSEENAVTVKIQGLPDIGSPDDE